MAIKKHNLTTGKDTIKGIGGADLFKGGQGALGSNDVLNGGGGIDTIVAELTGKHLAPVMKSIEHGVFTHNGSSKVGLDLVHAQQMTDLTLKNFAADAVIRHAGDVRSLTLSNLDHHKTTVSGIDTTHVAEEKIAFVNSTDMQLSFGTLGHKQLQKLDISLNNSQGSITGDVDVVDLAVHSISKAHNQFYYYSNSGLQTIQTVTLDGSAALDFGIGEGAAFTTMKSFDASGMDGALSTQLDSTKLTYVRGGSDNDNFTIYHLGGDQALKADLDMGAGADTITITEAAFNGSTMVLKGGDGIDTVFYNGADKGMANGFSGFETLKIENISGVYTINGDWTEIDLLSSTEFSDGAIFQGGTGLTMIKGSSGNDYISLNNIGGTVDHKAQIKLGAGDDTLGATGLILDAATQHFDGGKGHDGLVLSGNVADVGGIFTNFEYAYMFNMQGTYDFTGSGINGLVFGSVPAGAMTINGLESGSLIQIQTTQTTIMTVNVENAAGSQAESLSLELYGTTDVGNASFGVSAPDLSNLVISGFDSAHTMYLSQIGSATDLATLTVNGTAKVTMIASNASSSYIDTVVVNNTAGLNMLGLLDGTKALASSGVTITGGSGADVLVGGAGADKIASGGGDNIIHGSLGIDNVDISAGGLDMLIFHSQDQSAYNSGDNIAGFNIFDAIDISDLVSSVSFSNNVATFNAGVSTLSTSHSVGFFETANHTLYVDVNHDGSIDSTHDMEFHLTGLDTFNSTSLIG